MYSKKQKKDYFRMFLMTSLVFILVFSVSAPKAKAIPVAEVAVQLLNTTISQIQNILNTIATKKMQINDAQRMSWDQMDQESLPQIKSALVQAINSATNSSIGSGNNGKPRFVTNWDEYLYQKPKEETVKYMNTFFEKTTDSGLGAISEGIGQSYTSYMVEQAKASYEGQECKITMSEYASSPDLMFEDQSFRSLMAYTEPCNNPYTYTEIAKVAYEQELAKQQILADKEQVDGWLPKISTDGETIEAPATLYEFTANEASQLGNQAIVNAQTYKDIIQAATNSFSGDFNF